MPAFLTSSTDLHPKLYDALGWLAPASFEKFRQVALEVLREAESADDARSQGQALLCLARCDCAAGRFRRARRAADRAARLFARVRDLSAEVAALALCAQACSFIGQDEDALESALLSANLSKQLAAAPSVSRSHNALGFAYLGCEHFAHSAAAFEVAEQMAETAGQTTSLLVARIGKTWVEAFRLVKERYFLGQLVPSAQLMASIDQCEAMLHEATSLRVLAAGDTDLGELTLLTKALMICWSGAPYEARDTLDELEAITARGMPSCIQGILASWVRTECAWAVQDLPAAEEAAMTIIAKASKAEWARMADMGHFLLAQIYEQQGKYALSLSEHREMRRREHRAREDRLSSRHRTVSALLDARKSEDRVAHLTQYVHKLEQWSFEDSLTGLANRRRFEMYLADLLESGIDKAQPLSVALLDMDQFKSVNDAFGHSTGDTVLRAVADVLRHTLRDSDVAARLHGDEYAIVFPHTSLEQAEQVCLRVQQAVQALRWEHHPSLRVSLTFGFSQAHPGDTVGTLLHRSDLAMFTGKPLRQSYTPPDAAVA
jgi:diguanylate cyclase (GGDEF)-like protein